MRKLVLAALASLVLSPAIAADLKTAPPVYMKAPPVGGYSWTGAYVLGYVDYAVDLGSTSFNTPSPINLGTISRGPGFGGGLETLWELNGSAWVVGLNADVSWQNIKGSATANAIGAGQSTFTNQTDFLGSANVVLGLALGPDHRLLAAVEGGAGFGQTNPSFSAANTTLNTSLSQTSFGWDVGARLQYALTDNMSVFIKGKYYDLGSKQLLIGGVVTSSTPYNIFLQQIGLSFKFL